MSSDITTEQAISRHLAYLSSKSAREAYFVLILAFARSGYDMSLKAHDNPSNKRDIHFWRGDVGGKRPYSFMINQEDLLFYFRIPDSIPSNLHGLIAMPATKGENVVRIATADEARRLCQSLGLSPL
jgi:hypothetical protein